MKKRIEFLKDQHECHAFITESDTHSLITGILSIAVKFINGSITNEYFIRPRTKYFNIDIKGIERKADCAIFSKSFLNIVCLNEIKKFEVEFEECIRQNADQLRAYCICNNLKIGRGIATNGTIWVFVQYEYQGEKVKISEYYKVLDIIALKVIIDDGTLLNFFEILISFLKDSLDLFE